MKPPKVQIVRFGSAIEAGKSWMVLIRDPENQTETTVELKPQAGNLFSLYAEILNEKGRDRSGLIRPVALGCPAPDLPPPILPPSLPGSARDHLLAGDVLLPGQALRSGDRRFALLYQLDGNLVLLRRLDGLVLWAAGTMGVPGFVALQTDGNLVIYGAAGAGALWASGTTGLLRLLLQNDGNLVLYADDGLSRWSTSTARPDDTTLPPDDAPESAIGAWTADDRVFRQADGSAVRWKGRDAFRLLDRFAQGEDLTDFFRSCQGYNVLRVWFYVMWETNGWGLIPPVETVRRFLAVCAAAGFAVEFTLLTDDDPARIPELHGIVAQLALDPRPAALFHEIGNEPTTHKTINTPALRAVCEAAGFPFASGDYEALDTMPERVFGHYTTVHTPRDFEWVRKAKDAREIHDGWDRWTDGAGMEHPAFAGVHHPVILDEPIRPDQAGFVARDFYTYAALASLMGAGATFHSESGKQAGLPSAEEQRCAEAFLQGLNVFPPEAPIGVYGRIDEQGGTLRTYTVDPWMVRVHPATPTPPAGWVALDEWGIACRRAA